MAWVKKDNVGWVDVLRIVAIFAVVYSHTCDNFIAQFDHDRCSFVSGVFMECIARPCVVLMVMISGWLLLPVNPSYTLRSYYRKRIGRVIWPLVFWSLVLPVIFFLYFHYLGQGTQNPCIVVGSYTLTGMVTKMYTFIFNFNFDNTPLWYLYMLIGLYLVLPIVNSWLVQASKKDIQTVLGLWVISLFIPYLRVVAPLLGGSGEMGFAPLFGECDWNAVGTFYYMSGFLGYMILAYYLKIYPLNWSWKKTLAIGVPVYLIGYAVTSLGYIYVNSKLSGQYRFLEIPWYMCGINVAMQAFGVFIIFMKLKIKSCPCLSKMAAMMFGVYLCHFPFVQIAYDYFNLPFLPYPVRMMLIAVVTFVVSFLVTLALYSSHFTRRFVK